MEQAIERVTPMNEVYQRVPFRNAGLAVQSKAAYSAGVRAYYEYLRDTGMVEGMDSIISWAEGIRRTAKPSTFKLRIQGLKDYLLKKYELKIATRYGIEQGFKEIILVKPKDAVSVNEYLPYADIKRVAAQMTPIVRLIMCSLFWTGCRVSELVNIKLSDCKINHEGTAAFINVVGKGAKEREVQMPVALYKEALEQFKGKVYLFETSNGGQYNRRPLRVELKRQAKRQGYDIHPHTLRHSMAMYLKDSRHLSADQICKYLGHSDVAITLRHYFHGAPDTADLGIPSEGY